MSSTRRSPARAAVSLLVAVAVLAVFVPVVPAAAVAGFYVSAATGDDLNPGTSARPFKSVSQGVKAATEAGGVPVWVAPGTYSEADTGEKFPIAPGNGVAVRDWGGGPGAPVTVAGNGTDGVFDAVGMDHVEIRGLTITGAGTGRAGGIRVNDSVVAIAGNTFTGNVGSGIRVESGSVDIHNNVISKNGTATGAPGAWLEGSTEIAFYCNTVADNGGSGIAAKDCVPKVYDCILWGDGASSEVSGTCALTYSCVRGGYSGTGNIAASPSFVSSATGDYRLRLGSPCVDAGTDTGAPADDRAGSARPIDGNLDGVARTDMGAYEVNPDIHVSTVGSDTTGNGTAAKPFKSVTHGMSVATSGTDVLVAPGAYATSTTAETFPIELKPHVDLRGAGASVTTLNAGGAASVLEGVGMGASGSVQGLAVTGGNSVAPGGGIRLQDSAPSIADCVIAGNTTAMQGGGIFCWGASGPTIERCVLRDNAAADAGGALSCLGTSVWTRPYVRNCAIWRNTAPTGSVSYTSGAGATFLDNNTMVGNTGGPAVTARSAQALVNGCIVWGGAPPYISGGGVDVRNCDVQGGMPGWMMFNVPPSFVDTADGDFRLRADSQIIDQQFWNTSPADDFLGNTRPIDGDWDGDARPDFGAFEYDPWIHVATTGSDTTGTGSIDRPFKSVTHGMAVVGSPGIVLVAPGTYATTTTAEVFPIALKSGVDLRGSGATTTVLQGNGLSRVLAANGLNAPATLEGFTVRGGAADFGAALASTNATLTFADDIFTGNVASGSYCRGGALSLEGSGTAQILRSRFERNSCVEPWGDRGGAVYIGGPGGRLVDSVFTSNTAVAGQGLDRAQGGALCCQGPLSGSGVAIERCRFTGNGLWASYASMGGAAYFEACEVTIDTSEFVGNTAGCGYIGAGGGIFTDGGSLLLRDSLIARNLATGGGGPEGGGLYCQWSGGTIEGCTIAGNDASWHGGVSNNSPPAPEIVGSVLWGNTGAQIAGATSVRYSDVQESTPGTGNISEDPLFAGAAAGDYRLRLGSPCIDSDLSTTAPGADLDGVLRPQDGNRDGTFARDIGAYETPYFALSPDCGWTRSSTATAVSSFADADRVRYDFGSGWAAWAAFSGEATATGALPSGDGTKTVRAEFRYSTDPTRTLVLSDEICRDTRPVLSRVSGPNRYATAASISATGFPTADTVVLAAGEGFADALAASALAGSYRAPVLLTPSASLHASAQAEIVRLAPTRIFIVGGPSAVSTNVENTLRTRYASADVTRVAGGTRYATASEVASRVATHEGGAFAHRAFIARGDSFADALAASPLAFASKTPVLLVRPTSVPVETSAALGSLGVTSCVIAGSSSAVATSVATALAAGGRTVDRMGGATRYDTALEIAQYGVSRGWLTWERIGLATGENYPDALGGGATCGARGGPLLLTRTSALSQQTSAGLAARKTLIRRGLVFGGTPAVGGPAMASAEAVLR